MKLMAEMVLGIAEEKSFWSLIIPNISMCGRDGSGIMMVFPVIVQAPKQEGIADRILLFATAIPIPRLWIK